MPKAKKPLPAFIQNMMKNKDAAPMKGDKMAKDKKKPKAKKKG